MLEQNPDAASTTAATEEPTAAAAAESEEAAETAPATDAAEEEDVDIITHGERPTSSPLQDTLSSSLRHIFSLSGKKMPESHPDEFGSAKHPNSLESHSPMTPTSPKHRTQATQWNPQDVLDDSTDDDDDDDDDHQSPPRRRARLSTPRLHLVDAPPGNQAPDNYSPPLDVLLDRLAAPLRRDEPPLDHKQRCAQFASVVGIAPATFRALLALLGTRHFTRAQLQLCLAMLRTPPSSSSSSAAVVVVATAAAAAAARIDDDEHGCARIAAHFGCQPLDAKHALDAFWTGCARSACRFMPFPEIIVAAAAAAERTSRILQRHRAADAVAAASARRLAAIVVLPALRSATPMPGACGILSAVRLRGSRVLQCICQADGSVLWARLADVGVQCGDVPEFLLGPVVEEGDDDEAAVDGEEQPKMVVLRSPHRAQRRPHNWPRLSIADGFVVADRRFALRETVMRPVQRPRGQLDRRFNRCVDALTAIGRRALRRMVGVFGWLRANGAADEADGFVGWNADGRVAYDLPQFFNVDMEFIVAAAVAVHNFCVQRADEFYWSGEEDEGDEVNDEEEEEEEQLELRREKATAADESDAEGRRRREALIVEMFNNVMEM